MSNPKSAGTRKRPLFRGLRETAQSPEKVSNGARRNRRKIPFMQTFMPTSTLLPLEIFPSADAGCDFVAQAIARLVRARGAQGKNTVLGLATGATPIGIYKRLIQMNAAGLLSFRRVLTFNLDEYLGLRPDHPESYARFMEENLFSHIDIPRENTHIPPGNIAPEKIDAYCQSYEDAIRAAGGIDLQILGIGRSGHIGFNEPGSSIDSRTRRVELGEITRADAARAFGGIDRVPTQAVTMGISTILNARKIFLLAWGGQKAGIVTKTLHTPPSSDIPATFLQCHSGVSVCIDRAAAAELE